MDRDKDASPRQPEQDRVESKPPADVLRDGPLKASIWRNEGEKGPYYSTTFSRTYQDQEGNYRDTSSFVGGDNLKIAELARLAYSRSNEMRRAEFKEKREANAPDREQKRSR